MLDIETLALGYVLLCVTGGAASVSLLCAAGPPHRHAAAGAPACRRMALAAVLLAVLIL